MPLLREDVIKSCTTFYASPSPFGWMCVYNFHFPSLPSPATKNKAQKLKVEDGVLNVNKSRKFRIL